MRNKQKLFAACIAGIMMLTPVMGICEAAADKNEIVYATYTPEGNRKEVVVINRFEIEKDQWLTDYGTYDSVQNLTTTSSLQTKNGMVETQVTPGVFYYEGTLNDAQLPWNIGIQYLYNGASIMPEDLAGQRGSVEIILSIARNQNCKQDYFENYALSITTAFDTADCANIKAAGGVIANVGKKKQINYTVLPDTEKEFHITTYASQFAMDAININAVPVAMGIDGDDIDTEELKTDLKDLEDGVIELDDGAITLSDGVGELSDGADDLLSGSGKMSSAMRSLKTASTTITEGSNGISEGIQSVVDATTILGSNHQSLIDGADAILDADTQAVLTQAQGGIAAYSAAIPPVSTDMKSGIAGLETGADTLSSSIYTAGTQLSGAADGLTAFQSSASSSLGTASSNLETVLSAIGSASITPEAAAILNPYVALLTEALGNVNGVDSALTDASGSFTTIQTGVASAAGSMTSSGGPNGANTLYGGALGVKNGIDTYGTAVDTYTGTVDAFVSLANQYSSGMSQLNQGSIQLAKGIKAYLEGADELHTGIGTLKTGYATLHEGLATYTSGVNTLASNYSTLNSGVRTMVDGVEELVDGVAELVDGTAELRENTTGMDVIVDEKVQEALEKFNNEDYAPVSFTSVKNTPSMVQFVLKIDGITLPEEEAVVAVEATDDRKPMDRLKDLFN